jgi:hypothetical protein
MSAIITENFRRNNTRLFLNDISSPTNGKYYLGIGKQDRWDNDEELITFTPPVAVGTQADALEVLNNLSTLVSLNSLTGVGRVIPAVAWKSGNTYQAYSSYNGAPFYPSGALQPCYVTINGAIFLCLKAGSSTSSVQPTVQSSKYAPFTLSDGYIWALVQEAPSTQIVRNNTFTDISTTKLTGTEESNSTTQCGGVVTGFTIVSGGTGYNISSSVLKLRVNDGFVSGDAGTDRSSTFVTLDFTIGAGGAIATVSFPSGWPSAAAKGARFASIEFTGPGSGAKIVPTIAPPKGFAYDPSAVMPSWFAGLKVDLDDNISGDNFYSRYRQISIVKKPTVQVGQESAGTLNALKYISFPDITDITSLSGVDMTNSAVIRNTAGDVIGYADKLITTSGSKRLYFHQNLSSGYRELPSSGSIKINDGLTEYAYASINTGEFINDGNAEVLFTENRSFITRASGQTEDLILIIQF